MFHLPRIHKEVAKIAASYLVISFIWILASDKIMNMLISDPVVISHVSMFKGWFFVLVTSVLLYTQIYRYTSMIEKKETELEERNAELEHIMYMLACQINDMRLKENELKEKNRELDQFAYVISHDLKAPLRGINNLSQWIEEDLDGIMTEEVRTNMQLLRKRVQRMQDMIQGLLEYSRVGKAEGKNNLCSVANLINEIISDINPPEHFVINGGNDMPVLMTDSLLLRQVFTNLLDNAVKHHDKSKGRIDIAVKDMGEYYQFAVSDDGPGIAADYHGKIFELFQVLQPRDSKENTGVGLALVKKIVESQRGAITVESEVGCGTTMRFTWIK